MTGPPKTFGKVSKSGFAKNRVGGMFDAFFSVPRPIKTKKRGQRGKGREVVKLIPRFLFYWLWPPLFYPRLPISVLLAFARPLSIQTQCAGECWKNKLGRSLFLWLLPHCVLLVVAPAYFIGFSPSIIFGFELKLFNVQMLETLFYWCCASVILLAVAFWPHHVFLALARTRFVFNQYNLIF